MEYKIILDETGKMTSFCTIEDAIFDGVTYHDSPEGFNPRENTCEMQNGKLVLIPLPEETIDPNVETLEKVKNAFAQKRFDGENYFENKRAELFLGYKTGRFTLDECLGIEDILKPVKDRVITGDWLSASVKISALSSGNTTTESIIRGIESDIKLYIQNNYK